MSSNNRSLLVFNFGFLLEATLGTSRKLELDYPSVRVGDDLTLTPLTGKFTATRISEGVYVSGKLHSTVTAPCMRCLEEAISPITIHLDELFYYPETSLPAEEEYAFDGETGRIDLAPLVREIAFLSYPVRPICKPDCQGLCMECGQNLNIGDCDCEDDDIDPRMAALRGLLEQ